MVSITSLIKQKREMQKLFLKASGNAETKADKEMYKKMAAVEAKHVKILCKLGHVRCVTVKGHKKVTKA